MKKRMKAQLMFKTMILPIATLLATTAFANEDKGIIRDQLSEEYLLLNIDPSYNEDGVYYTEDDIPTFNIQEDGTLDWPSYSGFRRYHSECHVCHGPEGEGSSYAPALKDSAIELDYYDFIDVVVNGRQEINASTNSVMPAFGLNNNVMCYLDDIYVYLKGRGYGAIPRGRPSGREDKSDAIREKEADCLGI